MAVSWGRESPVASIVYPFMDETSVLLEAGDETLFLSFLGQLIVELLPVASPTRGVESLYPCTGAYRINHLEQLVVLLL